MLKKDGHIVSIYADNPQELVYWDLPYKFVEIENMFSLTNDGEVVLNGYVFAKFSDIKPS